MAAISGQLVYSGSYEKIRSELPGSAEQLGDVTLSIANVDTALGRHAKVRWTGADSTANGSLPSLRSVLVWMDLLLQCFAAIKLIRAPELDRC